MFSKYGLADGISRLNLDFAKGLLKNRDGEALARHTRETRVRMALEELGPTFIKLGQILSTRPDLVGTGVAKELQKLQDNVPIDAPEVVREIVSNELGQSIEELFLEFDDTPIASASIGQVHAAKLHDGNRVVIKVQHEGIQESIRKDLDVLTSLAQILKRLPEFALYHPVETVAEFQRSIRRELDFGREERNLSQFHARFKDYPHVKIPRPIVEFSTPRVLTMERLEGVKLSHIDGDLSFDREELARVGVDLFLEMIFTDGLFHADPHPGNVLVLPGNEIGLLDFGMTGRVDERLREDIEDLLMAIVSQDAVQLTSLIMRIGRTPAELDRSALQNDLSDFISLYGHQGIDRLALGSILEEMVEMIFRHHIVLPAQIAIIIKVFITLEGTSQILSPNFSLMEVIQRYQRKALLRRLSPSRRLKKIRRIYSEVEHLLESLPQRSAEILEQIQSGKFHVHLDHRGLEPSVNRLVLGMLASALFVGSALILSRRVKPWLPTFLGLEEVSILGLGGGIISVLLGLRLIRAIGKSGHLDRRE